MSGKRYGLGRGLDALLGATREMEPAVTRAIGAGTGGEREAITEVAIHQIQPGRHQPRREFDPESLQELAQSIAAQGVLQPIIVRPIGSDRFEIIAGERRWRAAQQAGLTEIPVVVREVDESVMLAIALIENIQRDDLRPLEEATALDRLLNEFGLTHQQVAEAIGKSRTMVTNLLRLLELNEEVKSMLQEGQIEMGHARALLGLKGEEQTAAANLVIAQGLSVRETEKLVRRLQSGEERPKGRRPASELDPNIRQLQLDLTDRLGAHVRIHHGARGTGRLIISYSSLDQLDGILERIK